MLEARPGVLGYLLERALGCTALASVPALSGEHLVDVAELQFGFPLGRAGGFPVENVCVSVMVKVGRNQRDHDDAQWNPDFRNEEVGLCHGPQAPAGAGRVLARARALRVLFGAT